MKKSIIKAFKGINYAFSLVLIPVLENFIGITNAFADIMKVKLKFMPKVTKKVLSRYKKLAKISIVFYYILLMLVELILFAKIMQGKIESLNFNILIMCTFVIICYSYIFIEMLRKSSNNNDFNIIVYVQILFLVPIVISYWIANIEGHSLILRELSAEQWTSIFNTLIIYFSGCFIGLITIYKMNKESTLLKIKK